MLYVECRVLLIMGPCKKVIMATGADGTEDSSTTGAGGLMIVPGSEEIKGLLGSRGITLFFFGSEGDLGGFPGLCLNTIIFMNNERF